jgi:hypothetical protein
MSSLWPKSSVYLLELLDDTRLVVLEAFMFRKVKLPAAIGMHFYTHPALCESVHFKGAAATTTA